MKCSKCGNEIKDGEKFCPNCGAPTETVVEPASPAANNHPDACGSVGVAFMWVSVVFCVVMAIWAFVAKEAIAQMMNQAMASAYSQMPAAEAAQTAQAMSTVSSYINIVLGIIFLVPLCWVLPMTIHGTVSLSKHRHIGTGFKVCTLIFVNLISGILLLCMKKD